MLLPPRRHPVRRLRRLDTPRDRDQLLKSLDRYYVAIEGTAKGIESWTERQEFLNTVYEGFFQGFSIKQADTHGIVYTPQEIVDFMCASVEEVLKAEFGLEDRDLNLNLGPLGDLL